MDTELIIVSYRRSDILAASLKTIRQLYPTLPICLGLQGDEAEDLARRMEHEFKVRTVCLEAPSVTESLNRCILSSAADLVLLLDDDAVPCSGWFDAHRSAFEADPDLPYSCGREVRINKGRSVPSEAMRIMVETLLRLVIPRHAVINGRVIGWLSIMKTVKLMMNSFNPIATALMKFATSFTSSPSGNSGKAKVRH